METTLYSKFLDEYTAMELFLLVSQIEPVISYLCKR